MRQYEARLHIDRLAELRDRLIMIAGDVQYPGDIGVEDYRNGIDCLSAPDSVIAPPGLPRAARYRAYQIRGET